MVQVRIQSNGRHFNQTNIFFLSFCFFSSFKLVRLCFLYPVFLFLGPETKCWQSYDTKKKILDSTEWQVTMAWRTRCWNKSSKGSEDSQKAGAELEHVRHCPRADLLSQSATWAWALSGQIQVGIQPWERLPFRENLLDINRLDISSAWTIYRLDAESWLFECGVYDMIYSWKNPCLPVKAVSFSFPYQRLLYGH